MSLVTVHLAKGLSDEVKLKIRHDISEHFGEVAQAPAKFFLVDFIEYDGINKDTGISDAFIWVYATEGHSEERKTNMCRLFTEDICRHTGFEPKHINFMFVDILKGNMGSGGKIVNRLGLVADLLREGKIKPEDLL